MPSSTLEKLIRFLPLMNFGMWIVDFIEFLVSFLLKCGRKKIEAEKDILVDAEMTERGRHGNIALVRTIRRRSRRLEERAARAAN